jgi:hypothetical protein
VSGTIPEALANLRALTYINLQNNWLNGTLPSWLHRHSTLRYINLGTQFGGNEGSELLGLMGQLPAQLGQLRQLQHLNLELNSLTGQLPPGLCEGGSNALPLLFCRCAANIYDELKHYRQTQNCRYSNETSGQLLC